jgi:hypothetical protein
VANLKILPGGENTNLADLESAYLEWTVHSSLELHHWVTDLLKHSSNDSIATLFDPHLYPCRIFIIAQNSGVALDETIREANPFFQFVQCRLRDTSLNASFVGALKAKARMHQFLGHLTIVSEHHQTR